MADDWRELVPTAFLLSGSDAGARDLLARGHARGGGVDGLVRAHLRHRFGRDVVLAGTPAQPWWVAPADAAAAAQLSAALGGLDRSERAAVVLLWFEQLPAAEVAARLPGVDTSALPGRLGVPVPELPARLELLAGTAQLADLDDAVADRLRAVRARRRRGVLVAAAVVAALVTGALWLPRGLPAPAPPTAAVTTAPLPPPPPGPARGSLTGDRDLVAALRSRLDPAADQPRLVYAGDGVGHRWVLLVARRTGRTDVHWFTGPRGAAPADLVETSVGYGGSLPPAWAIAVADPDGSTVMVVAEDGDGVEVSSGVDVARDGRTGRRFVPITPLDGVVTVRLDRPSGTGVEFHVVRDGAVVGTGTPAVTDGRPEPAPPAGPPRSGPGPVEPSAVALATGAVTGPTGWDAADLDVVVLGAGGHRAPEGRRVQPVTVAVTLPGGALVTSTAWTNPDGSGSVCGTEVHRAGTDPASLTVVTRCPADPVHPTGTSASGSTVVLVAPPGTRVELSDGAGGRPVVPDLDAGWAAVDGADGLTVFAVDDARGTISRAGAGPFD